MRISDWSSDVCSSDLAFAIFGVTKWVLGDLGAVIGGEGFLDAPSDALTGSVAAAATATTGFTGMDLFWCMMIGLVVTGLIVWITEYYTGTNYRPDRSIAKAPRTEATLVGKACDRTCRSRW